MSDFVGSLAGRMLDYLDDPGHPSLMKVAMEQPTLAGAIPDADDAAFIPDEQFAYVGMEKFAKVRHFPCVSPASTVASMECFRSSADVFTKEAQHKIAVAFHTACEWHGARMPDDIRAMLEGTQFPGGKAFYGDLQKTAAAAVPTTPVPMAMAKESSHALMLEYPDGQVARFYAMPDHESVKTAAGYFEEHHRSLAPEHRRTYATNVEKRAAELGVHDLDRGPTLSKYAASDFGPDWPEAIEYRYRLVGPDSRAGQAYEKLAGAIAEGLVAFPDAADYLADLDALAGVRNAGDPWASLAGGRKVASGFADEIDGDQVTADMLSKAVDSKQLLQLYGKSFMEEFSKRPTEVFSSLPDDDKRVVKEVLYGRA